MNYPVWDIPFLGAGLVVAIIAIIHVLISHFAIGGGAFLFVAEIWSDRQPDGERIRAWLHKYATFFLVYTTVFGAMTGVGIWFSIQLASPEGTSLLIHQYVFAWAIEWVMFVGELSLLYLYYYGWKSNSRRLQVWLAGLYFVIAWGSLFVINGILTFMLTPGNWTLENTDIVAGFFNPGYWPSLIIRTLIMFLVAGLGGLLIAARMGNGENGELKERIVSFSSRWVVPGAVLLPGLFYWYWTTLPTRTAELIEAGATGVGGGRLESMTLFAVAAAVAGTLIVLGSLLYQARPRALTFSAALALFLIAQILFMGGEFAREMARKPYVIYDTLYSNSLWKHKAEEPGYREQSYLSLTRWHPEVEPLSKEHGEWAFRLQCTSCHTRDGYRGMTSRTEAWTGVSGFKWLETMDQQGVMPPFVGTAEDRAAISAYIQSLHGREVTAPEILSAAKAEEEAAGKKAAEAAKAAPDKAPVGKEVTR
jgi:cytochrome d ubiquinol oxidase subunit I